MTGPGTSPASIDPTRLLTRRMTTRRLPQKTHSKAPLVIGDIVVGTPGGSGNSIGVRLTPGEHTVRSRAFDVDGNIQPAPDDPYLSSKVTYWESNGQITRKVRIPG